MKKIIKSVFASLIFGLAVQPLQAADLEVSDSARADAWTGFYVGGGISVSSPDIKNRPEIFSAQAGVCEEESCSAAAATSGGNATAGFSAAAAATCFEDGGTCSAASLAFIDDSFDLDVTGHVMAGYMRQYDIFILGIDGDYMFGDGVNGKPSNAALANPADLPVPSNFNSGFCDAVEADACAVAGVDVMFKPKGHVRGILGLELDENIMMFVAGGVAFADASVAITNFVSAQPNNAFGNTTRESERLVGYSVGAGAQAKVTSNVHARLEFLYDNFGSLSFNEASAAQAQTQVNGTENIAAATVAAGVKSASPIRYSAAQSSSSSDKHKQPDHKVRLAFEIAVMPLKVLSCRSLSGSFGTFRTPRQPLHYV